MSQAVDDHGFYEEWETAKMMELQDQELRRARKGAWRLPASSQGKAVALLYILSAFFFVLLMALIISSLQKRSLLLPSPSVTAVWEALEEARLRSEKVHAGSWQNLSHVQQFMEKQTSGEFTAFRRHLLNVSREVENMRAKMTQCEADCGKALSDRLRVLGERSPPSAWLLPLMGNPWFELFTKLQKKQRSYKAAVKSLRLWRARFR
nr:PREDICTED: uncharacterized protein LOC106487485 [Apteryx mantelli mantelli]